MVGDVVSGHRQRHRRRLALRTATRVAPCQVEQKGRQLLGRAHAAKQNHVVLSQAQLLDGEMEQGVSQLRAAVEQDFEIRPEKAAKTDGGDRLHREFVPAVDGEAQKITCEQKRGDQPPAIRQGARNAQRARADEKGMLGRFAFGNDRPVC
ncbi:MAG TPA: hypothetical protein VIK47_08120 [Kiloniellales bacterium]